MIATFIRRIWGLFPATVPHLQSQVQTARAMMRRRVRQSYVPVPGRRPWSWLPLSFRHAADLAAASSSKKTRRQLQSSTLVSPAAIRDRGYLDAQFAGSSVPRWTPPVRAVPAAGRPAPCDATPVRVLATGPSGMIFAAIEVGFTCCLAFGAGARGINKKHCCVDHALFDSLLVAHSISRDRRPHHVAVTAVHRGSLATLSDGGLSV